MIVPMEELCPAVFPQVLGRAKVEPGVELVDDAAVLVHCMQADGVGRHAREEKRIQLRSDERCFQHTRHLLVRPRRHDDDSAQPEPKRFASAASCEEPSRRAVPHSALASCSHLTRGVLQLASVCDLGTD